MSQKSLTLVEITVSMVVLSLVLLGIAGLFVAGKRQLKRAQFKQEALNFARQKLEELTALDFDDVSLIGDCPGGCEYQDKSLPYEGWKTAWRITNLDENFNPTLSKNPQYKKITVTVEWQEP